MKAKYAKNAGGKELQKAHRLIDGVKYYPTLYVGRYIGHGKYIAAMNSDGELYSDSSGVPFHYSKL